MNELTVGIVQLCSGVSVADNLSHAKQRIAQAAEQGAQLVVLPEYFPVMGHKEEDKRSIQEVMGLGPIQSHLRDWAKTYGVWIIGGTLPIQSSDPKRPFGRTLVFNERGECVAHYDKIHLFDVQVNDSQGSYCESRGTYPGSQPTVCETPWGKMGLAVCYDLRFPELFRYYATQGVTLLALPAAFTATTGHAHWEVLLRARAIENQCFVLASAQAGHHQNGRETWGHSMVVDPWGTIVGQLAQQPDVLIAKLDLRMPQELAKKMPVLQHRKL
jgi:nitrilase